MRPFFPALLIALLSLVPVSAPAQISSQAEQRREQTKKFIRTLNLTSEQAKAIQSTARKYAPQKAAIEKKILGEARKAVAEKPASDKASRAKALRPLAQRQALLKPIQDKQSQEINKLLSPAQQKTWRAFERYQAAQGG